MDKEKLLSYHFYFTEEGYYAERKSTTLEETADMDVESEEDIKGDKELTSQRHTNSL